MANAKQPHLRLAPAPKPIGGLLDPRFVYVRSEHTDIRKTFDRIRAQQQKEIQK
jgi:hypothetical protein